MAPCHTHTQTHTQCLTKYAALRQGEISLYLTTRRPKIKEKNEAPGNKERKKDEKLKN